MFHRKHTTNTIRPTHHVISIVNIFLWISLYCFVSLFVYHIRRTALLRLTKSEKKLMGRGIRTFAILCGPLIEFIFWWFWDAGETRVWCTLRIPAQKKNVIRMVWIRALSHFYIILEFSTICDTKPKEQTNTCWFCIGKQNCVTVRYKKRSNSLRMTRCPNRNVREYFFNSIFGYGQA